MDALTRKLDQVRRRLGVYRWMGHLATALIASLTAACVWLLAVRLFPVLGPLEPVVLALVALGVLVATGWSIYRWPTREEAALETDRRLGVKERLTTSLALAGRDDPMAAAVHRDARARLDSLEIGQEFPLLASRRVRWAAIPLALFAAGYLLLPELDLFNYQQRRVEAKRMEAERVDRAERITEAAERVKETLEEGTPGLEGLEGELDRLAEELKHGDITDQQAMARLSDIGKEVIDAKEAMNTPRPDLNTLADQTVETADAAEAVDAMGKGDYAKAAEKMQAMQEQMQQLAEKANQGALSAEDREKMQGLARDAARLAEAMGGEQNEQLAEALKQAAASMASGDPRSLAEACEQAGLSMQDMASMMQQLQQMGKLDEALAKMGEWSESTFGPSDFCRICGTGECEGGACKNGCCQGRGMARMGAAGQWAEGEIESQGAGMGGPGRGRGGGMQQADGGDERFAPSVLPGEMTRGKILASIMQRTAPDEEAETSIEGVTESFRQVRQSAEEALTQEEIPPGAKEFVRQYFGSINPEEESDGGGGS